jgi:putative endonuclease
MDDGPAARSSTGRWGEALAAEHLARRGWTVVNRNFRSVDGEIDLVARRGEVVAFVEVKTRRGRVLGHPLDSITPRKRHRIGCAAEAWVAVHGEDCLTYRFDAIAVAGDPRGGVRIDHLPDAWRAP